MQDVAEKFCASRAARRNLNFLPTAATTRKHQTQEDNEIIYPINVEDFKIQDIRFHVSCIFLYKQMNVITFLYTGYRI